MDLWEKKIFHILWLYLIHIHKSTLVNITTTNIWLFTLKQNNTWSLMFITWWGSTWQKLEIFFLRIKYKLQIFETQCFLKYTHYLTVFLLFRFKTSKRTKKTLSHCIGMGLLLPSLLMDLNLSFLKIISKIIKNFT